MYGFVKFTKILIIACLFNLFCQQLIPIISSFLVDNDVNKVHRKFPIDTCLICLKFFPAIRCYYSDWFLFYFNTYKLAKFLVPTLKPVTSNEYMVKDSFAFVEEIVEQDSEFFYGKP